MPMYDWTCEDCFKVFEGLGRLNQATKTCVCGGTAVRHHTFYPPMILFTGDGRMSGTRSSDWNLAKMGNDLEGS
jgi:putative FmdB family regulatory protein